MPSKPTKESFKIKRGKSTKKSTWLGSVSIIFEAELKFKDVQTSKVKVEVFKFAEKMFALRVDNVMREKIRGLQAELDSMDAEINKGVGPKDLEFLQNNGGGITEKNIQNWMARKVNTFELSLGLSVSAIEDAMNAELRSLDQAVTKKFAEQVVFDARVSSLKVVAKETIKVTSKVTSHLVHKALLAAASSGASVLPEALVTVKDIGTVMLSIKENCEALAKNLDTESAALARMDDAYKNVRKAISALNKEAVKVDRFSVVRSAKLKKLDYKVRELQALQNKLDKAGIKDGTLGKKLTVKGQYNVLAAKGRTAKAAVADAQSNAAALWKVVGDAKPPQGVIEKATALYDANADMISVAEASFKTALNYVKLKK